MGLTERHKLLRSCWNLVPQKKNQKSKLGCDLRPPEHDLILFRLPPAGAREEAYCFAAAAGSPAAGSAAACFGDCCWAASSIPLSVQIASHTSTSLTGEGHVSDRGTLALLGRCQPLLIRRLENK